MTPTCIMIALGLCVAPKFEAVTDVTGMFTPKPHPQAFYDGIERLGVSIEVFETDFFFPVPTAVMNRICKNGSCTYYRKHCDFVLNICRYKIGAINSEGRGLYLNDFSIMFRTRKALKLAERGIYFVAGEGPSSQHTAFSEMTGDLPLVDVQQCFWRVFNPRDEIWTEQGCPPLLHRN